MTSKIVQPLDRKDIAKRALLAGTARALNMIERMSTRFSHRGWPKDDRMHVATAAVCYVILGIGQQMFNVPPGANDPPCWQKITPHATANQIVEALELDDMRKPEKITSRPLSIVK